MGDQNCKICHFYSFRMIGNLNLLIQNRGSIFQFVRYRWIFEIFRHWWRFELYECSLVSTVEEYKFHVNWTWNLGWERRAVDVFVLETNVNVVLSGWYRYVDVGHNSVLFLLLDNIRLARSINLHVEVFCTLYTLSQNVNASESKICV